MSKGQFFSIGNRNDLISISAKVRLIGNSEIEFAIRDLYKLMNTADSKINNIAKNNEIFTKEVERATYVLGEKLSIEFSSRIVKIEQLMKDDLGTRTFQYKKNNI